MFQRLQASPATSHGYRPLGSEPLSHTTLSPELSGHHTHSENTAPPLKRSSTFATAKSYGDLKALQGRSRTKKSRAIKWLVLHASGERQLFTLDKRQLIQTCRLEIPIRDMRLMDSALGTETLAQLLVRDNALVFSMEHVRLIITHDKVVVPLDDGGQPPAPPPSAPQPPPTPMTGMDRGGGGGGGFGGASSNEQKDRFINHLEGVVMDWALQHGATVLPTGASNGGGGATATVGSHPAAGPVAQIAAAAGGGAGVAASAPAPSLVATLEAHVASSSKAAGTPRGGPGSVTGPGGQQSTGGAGMAGSETASQTAFDPEYQPFEMLVLETALTEICSHLSREVDTLQMNCQPALEALMKTADTANLEAVRRVKTQHARLVTRVTATREALERLMEDDDDMMRMCLTQQAHMRIAAVAAAAAAQQQHSAHHHHHHHHHHHGHHHSHDEGATGAAAGGGGGGGGAVPSTPIAATLGLDLGRLPSGSDGYAHSPRSRSASPPLTDAHQLAILMGSSLSASYMRPASLAARAVRHSAAKKGGALGEALAEAAAVAAAAAAVSGAATAAGGACGGGGGGGAAAAAPGTGSELVEHDFLDVENLLESYAIIVDTTYQTLMSIGEYIDDTEDLINIQLDFSRNKLIRFDILLTSGTFALAFFNIVTGMLGENLVLPEAITQDLWGFALINGGTLCFCFATFITLVAIFKWQKII